MPFVEPTFLFFFLPILLAIHAICPRALRNSLLTIASLVFYAWGEKEYAVLMLVSIGLNYILGRMLGSRAGDRTRRDRVLLGLAIIGNLGLLAVFKYANFVADNLNLILEAIGIAGIELAPVHLPIGISFFTFQGMSYVIDVYRGRTDVQRDPMKLGLYISLFPQLIAGPIVRYQEIARQIVVRRTSSTLFHEGVHRFTIGAAKKMLVANPMGAVVDGVFALPADQLTSPIAWLGAACYTLQIYFDFSGYSDMAIGLGRMFGFRIPRNFNYPYIATSITDFWRRWHISLSRWFRDYLYIPLGGNRGSAFSTYRNLVIVFFLCGLWHGANWAFIVWGLYHGFFLVIERFGVAALLARVPAFMRLLYTMLVTILGWVLFRAATGPVPDGVGEMTYAADYVSVMFTGGDGFGGVRTIGEFMDPRAWLVLVCGIIAATPVYLIMMRRIGRTRRRQVVTSTMSRGSLAAFRILLLVLVVILVAAETNNPFIYFQF